MDGFDNEPEEEGCDNDVDIGEIVVVDCTETVEGTRCTFSRPFLYIRTLIYSAQSEDCENVKQAALIAWGAVKVWIGAFETGSLFCHIGEGSLTF